MVSTSLLYRIDQYIFRKSNTLKILSTVFENLRQKITTTFQQVLKNQHFLWQFDHGNIQRICCRNLHYN